MRSLVFVVAIALMPSSGLAQKVTNDWDVAKDFSQIRTYTWPMGEISGNALVDNRVKMNVDTQLQAKGLRAVTDVNQADAAVVVNIANQQKSQAIVVDIFDAKSRARLWHATATDSVSDDPEKNAKKIAKAIEKMFKKFPPPKK